jgi:hypothetical protein
LLKQKQPKPKNKNSFVVFLLKQKHESEVKLGSFLIPPDFTSLGFTSLLNANKVATEVVLLNLLFLLKQNHASKQGKVGARKSWSKENQAQQSQY